MSKLQKYGINYIFGFSQTQLKSEELNKIIYNKTINVQSSNSHWDGYLATGYSKANGRTKPGVMFYNSSPNFYNVLQNAKREHIPLVVFNNNKDLSSYLSQYTVKQYGIEEFNLGFETSINYRMPVLINMFREDNSSDNCDSTTQTYPLYQKYYPFHLIDKIRKAQSPFFIIGPDSVSNRHLGEDIKLLRSFMLNLNLPHTSTELSRGYCNYVHPMYLKPSVAKWAISQSDLVVRIGCIGDDYQNQNRNKMSCFVNINCNQNKDSYNIYNANANHHTLLIDLVNLTNTFHVNKYTNLVNWRKKVAYYKQQLLNKEDITSCKQVAIAISKLLSFNPNITLVVGTSCCIENIYDFVNFYHPNQLICSSSLTPIGNGIQLAIGAALSKRDLNNLNPVIVLIDITSLHQLIFRDIKLISDFKLPIKIIILNKSRELTEYGNFLDIAKQYQIETVHCYDSRELIGLFKQLNDSSSSLIVNVYLRDESINHINAVDVAV